MTFSRVTLARSLAVLLVAFGLAVPIAFRSTAHAAAPLTVAQAIGNQSGTGTVRGYVVGQPTATSTVVRSGFPNDFAMALADSAGETSTARMLYVQIPSAFRSTWGLKSHPELMGRQVDVTGTLAAYFSHPGLTNGTAFATAGGGTDPGDPGDPGDYYSGTSGLSGAALEARLHTIISTGVTTLSYDGVWDALKDTDQDPNNPSNVIELYTGHSVPKSDNGGGVDQWNREHVWAKSHGDFGTANGPGTDVHHLRPADVTVNSDRGNLDFDDGGTENAEAPGNYSDSDSWEPRDAVKGDVARMIFYMSVRWDGGDGHPDLEVNDQVNNGTAPHIGKLTTLLAWNAQDPPDSFEERRNEEIYTRWQHNRNPFVDHPAWADAIWN
jgi:endonuclease I